MAEIPKEMMTMVVTSPGNGTTVRDVTVEIKTVPVPVPKRGEVLVKVAAAPINPSDYGSWYLSSAKAYPMNMGNEGCGIVVASGGGLSTYRVPGRSVPIDGSLRRLNEISTRFVMITTSQSEPQSGF